MRVFCFILGVCMMLEGMWASDSDSSFELPVGERELRDTPTDGIGSTPGVIVQPGRLRAAGHANMLFLTQSATTVTVMASYYRDGVEFVHSILDRPMGEVSLEAILGRSWGEFKSSVVVPRIRSLDAAFSEVTAAHLTVMDIGTGKVIDDGEAVRADHATSPKIAVHVSVD